MSDFELVDLKSEKKEQASCYKYIEQYVHDLFDNNRVEPVYYNKKKDYNKSCNCYLDRHINKYQGCVIYKEDSVDVNITNIILSIEDGNKYLVKRVSINNKIFDEKSETPHDQCIICYEYIKNHVMIPCGHVITCTRCTKMFLNNATKCPICNVSSTNIIRIFK